MSAARHVRPGGLLVVGLHGLGHVKVTDEPHVRLVDAHAEGIGGGDHAQFSPLPPLLHGIPFLLAQPRVVEPRIHPLRLQECRDVPRRLPLPDIHYSRTLHGAADCKQGSELIFGLPYYI